MTTHSDQIEMCSLRLIYIICMEIQAKINEAIKQRNIFFTQSLMLPNIFPSFEISALRLVFCCYKKLHIRLSIPLI